MNYFVSGANRGLGLELVKQLLLKEDAIVFATARSLDDATELQRLAVTNEGRLHLYPLDISCDQSIHELKIVLDDEPIDYLINNAGRLTPSGTFPDINPQDILDEFSTNTVGTLKVCQALYDNVLKSTKKTIINVSTKMASIADNSSGGVYPYRISKTALNMATRSLANDVRDAGVTAVVVHPGWVQTRMGGANAPITTEESIKGLIQVFDSLTIEKTGHFIEYTGKELPW